MLFIYPDLDETKIRQWFHSFDNYRVVIHLYRALFYNNRLFIETKFLNIAQALESLHSLRFGNQRLPHNEFVDRKRRVLQEVPDELRDRVREALNNANYKPFRCKISELLLNKQNIIGPFIDDFELFSKRVMHTRNELVHHNKRTLAFENGRELFSAINILTILFEAYILEILGFTDDEANYLLNAKIKSHLSGWKTLRPIKKQ